MSRLGAFMLLVLALPAVQAAPTHRIFVSNEKSDTVSVIDSRTDQVEATIEVGHRPRGIGFAPDHSALYVALGEEGKIAVIDPKTLKILRKFDCGPDPEAFAVHPDGNIYISMEDNAAANVYNPKTGDQIADIRIGLEPEGVAISPDGSRVVVTSESNNKLYVIAVPENKVIAEIPMGLRPRAATFNDDGKIAYASSEVGGTVVRIDMVHDKVEKTVTIPGRDAKPKDVVLSRDQKTLFVAGGRANKVYVLNADSLAVETTIPVGKRVWGMALSRDGRRLYTANGDSNDVSVIDTASYEVVDTIAVGKAPWGLVIDD